jgi:hypothetical protein
MSRYTRRHVLVAVLAAALGVVWLAYRAAALPPASAAPYPPNTYISEVGVRLAEPLPGDVAKTSGDNAVRTALTNAGGLADAAKPYSVQLTRFTDENYGPDDGPRVIDGRLVWLVRFTGTPQPVFGPMWQGNQEPYPNPAMELNVVVDAESGLVLESFSYR